LLILVQNDVELPVGEGNLPPQEAVGLLARDALEALEQRVVDELRAELLDQLHVV
jgi:hypothetical protein